MEFSYSISLRDAREAFWLNYWNLRTKVAAGIFGVALLADFILLGLGVVEGLRAGDGLLKSLNSDVNSTFLMLLAVLAFFFVWLFVVAPWMALRPLRKNPSLLVCRKASATAESFEVQAEAGSSRLGWSLYKYWREGKRVIILKTVTGQYQAINKAQLSDVERDELRGILGKALPLKE